MSVGKSFQLNYVVQLDYCSRFAQQNAYYNLYDL